MFPPKFRSSSLTININYKMNPIELTARSIKCTVRDMYQTVVYLHTL